MGVVRLRHILLTALLTASCTKTIYVPQTRTEYVNRERVDSLFIHDSIFVTERVKGDTVYRYNDRWHTAYKLEVRVDTVVKCDSIPYPVEVVRTEYKTPRVVSVFAVLGFLSLLFVGYKLWARLV